MSNEKIEQLGTSKPWIKLKEYWKTLGETYNSGLHIRLKPGLSKGGNILLSFDEKVTNSIEEIKTGKLLEENESSYLQKLIYERKMHVAGTVGLITCYFTGGIPEERKIRDELEKRYSLLQNLYEEGKINSQTYKEVRETIIEDLKELTAFKTQQDIKNIEIPDDTIELIMELNK